MKNIAPLSQPQYITRKVANRNQPVQEFPPGSDPRRSRSVAKRHTKHYNQVVKLFQWNKEKNETLKAERQVSFEDVVMCIEKGFLLDILENPNQERYQGQKIFVVLIEGYAYLVPFSENEHEVFLKTIIPSRKATKKYRKGIDNE